MFNYMLFILYFESNFSANITMETSEPDLITLLLFWPSQ